MKSQSQRELSERERSDEIMRIMRTAVRKAQAENRRLGVPSYYVINGIGYYELPNGDFVRAEPESVDNDSE